MSALTLELSIILYLVLTIALFTISNLSRLGHIAAFIINFVAVSAIGFTLFSNSSFQYQEFMSLGENKLTLARILIGINLLVCLQYGVRSRINVKLALVSSIMATLGALAAGLVNLVALFVIIETISLFNIVFIARSNRSRSRDVSVKHLILNSISSILGAIALGLFYVGTGGVSINEFGILHSAAFQFAVVSFVAYFFSKLGVFPFQVWIFDYLVNIERKNLIPTLLVERIATIPVLASLVYVLLQKLPDLSLLYWKGGIISVAIISTVIAALKGMGSCGFKKKVSSFMLLHSGVIVLSFCLPYSVGVAREVLFYYVFMLVGLAGALSILNEANSGDKDLDEIYDGYYRRRPISCFKFSVYLLSLAGFPMTMGFSTRYMVLVRYFSEEQIISAIVMIVMMLFCLIFSFQMIASIYLNKAKSICTPSVERVERGVSVIEWVFIALLLFGGHIVAYI